MDTSAPQWPQGIGVVKSVEKKARPPKEQALNCPRCSSTNTKFCYYNNYSLSQPRYFCKTCRRYWTEGGCLRNVPVGGGSRKNRRPASSSTPPAAVLSLADKSTDHNPNPNPNPKTVHGQDLNLAYNNSIGMSEYIAMPFDSQNPNFPSSHHPLPVMEFFKPANVYNNVSSGFPVMHDFKAGLGFSVEGYYGNLQDGDSKNNVFPFGEMKQDQHHQHQQQLDQLQERSQADQGGNGFWNGMLAGGSSW